jgi:hypothetical protein
MSETKWQRSSLRRLSQELRKTGHRVSHTTIARLLHEQHYTLKANEKRLSGAAHPDRDQQFEYLNKLKADYLAAGQPVISVDSKKKELIGNFRNNGRAWCQKATAVNEHDFDQDALGKAAPYGIYDLAHNLGYVYVGQSADTPQFAVDMIARWWQSMGCLLYPGQTKLLILADAGGSNGCRPHLWKQQIQEQLVNRLGLEVTVCHYPTGASKWNPIEHRLFGPISINWAGKPLRTFETMLAYIGGTVNATGLQVKAFLVDQVYEKGSKVAEEVFESINIQSHEVCPRWNYTIGPQPACT